MKKWLAAALVFNLGGMALAEAEKVPTPVVNSVAVAAPLKDKASASAVEAGIKSHFLGSGVNAVSLHTLYSSTVPAAIELRADLQAKGFAHILCMTPRRHIRFSSVPLAVP